MSNIWAFIIPCAVIAFIGTKIKKPDSQIFEDWKFPWGPSTGSRVPGKIMFLIGASGMCIGIYAAFRGPVRLGGLNLPQSAKLTNAVDSILNKKASMKTKYARKKKVKKAKKELTAKEYVDSQVIVNGKWHVTSKAGRSYKGFVRNGSNKKLGSVTFQLIGKTKNTSLTVHNIAPFENKEFDFKLDLHTWRMRVGGPAITGASY